MKHLAAGFLLLLLASSTPNYSRAEPEIAKMYVGLTTEFVGSTTNYDMTLDETSVRGKPFERWINIRTRDYAPDELTALQVYRDNRWAWVEIYRRKDCHAPESNWLVTFRRTVFTLVPVYLQKGCFQGVLSDEQIGSVELNLNSVVDALHKPTHLTRSDILTLEIAVP